MRRTESDLFGFGKEIVRVWLRTIFPTGVNGTSSSGTSFRRVKNIKAKGVRLFLCEYLHAEFVLRVNTSFNGLQ